MEESIADDEMSEAMIGDLIISMKIYLMKEHQEENTNICGVELWTMIIQKVKQRFVETQQFTKEPEDPRSNDEDSPESYELERDVDYEIRIEDNNTWSILELVKDKIKEMGGRFNDKDIQKIWANSNIAPLLAKLYIATICPFSAAF
ncbi:hypothetical protein RhiirA4_470176 [Rhizophagus irregularis]|uniref:Uncharacterized protein n=1 Tax=Rhizophagus irregularis TaxID=588596 RepID=A0A2I1H0V8_9GLOM|nr:hypothetical protein RhiirA4_470176 [Rhizophagus irregularis]